MYCKNCGNNLEENELYCSKCGTMKEQINSVESLSNNSKKCKKLLSNVLTRMMFNTISSLSLAAIIISFIYFDKNILGILILLLAIGILLFSEIKLSYNKKSKHDAYEDNQDRINIGTEKYNIILSDLFIYKIFTVLFFLSLMAEITLLFTTPDYNISSGFFIFIGFFYTAIMIFPQAIGLVLSNINIKYKNRILVVIMFISSLFSIVTTVIIYRNMYNRVSCYIILLLNIVLSIILLFKSILKK